VLFIPSGSIGDALMMLALCGEILKYQPDARITIIARRNGALIRDLARAYPRISVYVIQKNPVGAWTLLWQSFKRPYTALMPAAFGLGSVWNTAFFFKMLSLRPGNVTAGLLKKKGDPDPYQRSEVYNTGILHFDSMRRLAVLGGLTVAPQGSLLSLNLAAKTPERYAEMKGAYIVLHPFGSSSWKSWPPRRSKELLDKLGKLYPSFNFVVTGGKENEKAAKDIAQGMPRTTTATGLPILEAAGVIQDAALFIGVDTGTLHLASVMNQKVIALEHNASPEWLPTYNPSAVVLTNREHCMCGGVKNDSCVAWEDGVPYMRCLYEIADETILSAVGAFLAPVQ